eukprot:361905-Chlamydomonas_euryale.AAC.1
MRAGRGGEGGGGEGKGGKGEGGAKGRVKGGTARGKGGGERGRGEGECMLGQRGMSTESNNVHASRHVVPGGRFASA